MMSNNNIKEKTTLEYNLTQINEFIDNSNISKLDSFVKNLHNADIAEIIQNLDDESRLNFILKIKNYFDPEILTYLNESIRSLISDPPFISLSNSNLPCFFIKKLARFFFLFVVLLTKIIHFSLEILFIFDIAIFKFFLEKYE